MSEAGCIVFNSLVAHNYNYVIFDNLIKKFFLKKIWKKLKHLVEAGLEPALS